VSLENLSSIKFVGGHSQLHTKIDPIGFVSIAITVHTSVRPCKIRFSESLHHLGRRASELLPNLGERHPDINKQ
jgi:hypothetical protein